MALLSGIRDFVTLKRRERWPADRLRAFQAQELRRVVGYAVEHSPFYAELYSGHDLDDFASLPVIDKQVMMSRFDDLNTAGLRADDLTAFAIEQERRQEFSGYFRDRWVVGLSSGTSGGRGIVLTDRALTARLPFVFAARSGIPLSMLPWRIVFMLRVFSQGFADIASPLVSISYVPTMTDPEEVARRARDARANVLMGPPSALRLLAGVAGRMPRIRLVVSYAEVLEDHVADLVRSAFGAPLIQIYQASEGAMGCTCACGSLHINEDLMYVELLDSAGRPVTEPGTLCDEMVVTNLYNLAQPLIRYRMGDIVELGGPCPCGSSFRTIARIVGRRDDVLWVRSGDALRPLFPDLVSRWIITASPRVEEYRVDQDSPDALRVRLRLAGDGDPGPVHAAVAAAFADRMAELGLDPAQVRIEAMGATDERPGAKPKRFVRHFDEPPSALPLAPPRAAPPVPPV